MSAEKPRECIEDIINALEKFREVDCKGFRCDECKLNKDMYEGESICYSLDKILGVIIDDAL